MIPYGHQSVNDDDVAEVVAALRSERLTQGPRVEAFEAALAERVGARHAVAFSSGTAGLHAAAHVAGVGPGDTVATSALTFAASATCALFVGAEPVLVDVDPGTLNVDPALVPDCDALVAVHYAGLPVDLGQLRARPRVVIEDAAHALGAHTADGPVGNCARSDLCVFSFHPVKAVTTGEGGAVTTNSDELADGLRRFRHHGVAPRPDRGGWAYDVREVGFNYRLSDLHAALGASQLRRLDEFVDRRRHLAARYRDALSGAPVVLPPEEPEGVRHAYHLFPVRVGDRRRVYDALHAAGVGVQVHYVPLHHHEALARFRRVPDDLPATEEAYGGLLSLPLYPDLGEDEQDAVVAALLDAVGTGTAPEVSTRVGESRGAAERQLGRSRMLHERGRAVIPRATQTLSKGSDQFVAGVSPLYLERGRGAHVWDVDGNRYLDYPMALGPVILGYGDPGVDAAIRRQLDDGITFTLPHPLEVEVAERVVELCPGVEAVRFGKSGSDALAAAVRAARALTGRDRVLTAGYHGWHDWYAGATSRAAGVPTAVADLVTRFEFNDADGLRRALDAHAGEVAAVVVEPSGAELPAPGFLDEVVAAARRAGAVSIFDEVITGFRVAPGGARERYGVQPDLSCYGKAMGNGMPVSAVAGGWDTMRAFDEVFFSLTHGGETLSLAAACAVLDALADGEVLRAIERLGALLRDGIRDLIDAHGLDGRVTVGGEPHRSVVGFAGHNHLADRTWVQQRLVERGVLFNGSMFVCARHERRDVEDTLAAFDDAFTALEKHDDVSHLLAGPPVEPVLRS